MTPACSPRSPEIARQRLGVAMGGEHTRGASLGYRLQERGPVGVIGEREAPVEPALPPDAAYAHEA